MTATETTDVAAALAQLLQADREILPGYRLVKFLGRGGFGEVWEAIAPGGIAKAVKVTSLLNGSNQRELDGLRQVSALRHPYLLAIDRFEVVNDFLVIVTELADKNLADRFDECSAEGRQGIPREELLGYMHEAAEVLDLLVGQYSLQHLDVKPSNLFLVSGHVKVADFGLVQSMHDQQQGMAFTPAYAPPELFGGRIESTSDQYSLAVTYQQLLTGCRPYPATDYCELIFQHVSCQPDLSMLPEPDRKLVGRALCGVPKDRFRTCNEFTRSLRQAPEAPLPVRQARSVPAQRPLSEEAPTLERPGMQRLSSESLGSFPSLLIPPTAFAPAKLPAAPPPAERREMADDPPTERNPIRKPPPSPIPQPPAQPLHARQPKPVASRPPVQRAAEPKTLTFSVDLEPEVVEPPTDQFAEPTRSNLEAGVVTANFLASLPLEIFAHKLRAFVDALAAEVESCTIEKTVLKLRPDRGGWFGFSNKRCLTVELRTIAVEKTDSDLRRVDVRITSTVREIQGPALTVRGGLLVQCVRA
ncbi:MAG: serine/threonine protein kinase, partial [Planctomycetia bacterium]